jgi:hypothetical protein
MKFFRTIFLVFCLGVFIIPKANMVAPISIENCCEGSTSKKNCCKQDGSSEHKDKKDHCKDSCCTLCSACFSVLDPTLSKNFLSNNDVNFENKTSKKVFSYSDPSFSNRFKEIWQPPKIG